MSEILLTTTVGSFGKPDYLQKARNANARGKLSDAELLDLEKKATEEWIRRQEEIDLDDLKWVVLMVLFNQPGQEAAFAWMESHMFEGEGEPLH